MAAQAVEAILSEWFSKDSEAVADEGVLQFLSGFLLDETTDEDPEQLEMYLDCYSPQFAAKSKEEKSEEVNFLLKSARTARTQNEKRSPSPPTATSKNPISNLTSIGTSVPVKPKHDDKSKQKTEDELLCDAIANLKLIEQTNTAKYMSEARELCALWGVEVPSSSSNSTNSTNSTNSSSSSLHLRMTDAAPCLPYFIHLLKNVFKGSVENAAIWCLDKGLEELKALDVAWRKNLLSEHQEKLRELEEAEKTKKLTIDQFLYRELKDTPTTVVPLAKPLEEKNERIRYHDGQVVSTKGEKYVVQKLTEDWDGGSRGKVYTKGKRGKGFH